MRRSPHEHGPGQDVPYHIAYFDHVMVADPIEFGTTLQDRFECLTIRQLNDWNRAEFATRRPGQTPEESVADMLRQRERIRTLIAPLTDPDLEKPAFSHFFGVGFSTVGSALAGARQHAFSEDWELAQRLWRWDLTLPESVVHSGVAAYVRLMGSMVDREVARRIGHFTIVMDMPGYAGGAWTRLRQDGYLRQVVPGPDIGRTHARRRGHRRRRCRLTLDGPPMMGSTHLGGVLTTLRSRYRSVQINFDRVSAPIKPEPQGCRGAKRFV